MKIKSISFNNPIRIESNKLNNKFVSPNVYILDFRREDKVFWTVQQKASSELFFSAGEWNVY
jgi:hypothetical protein